ncbi:hypothetical protein [Sphingomonas sp.]
MKVDQAVRVVVLRARIECQRGFWSARCRQLQDQPPEHADAVLIGR